MKLYLDSSKSTNNRFTLDNTINGRWELISFVCTNNLFNVNEYNNKVYFNENGTDRIGTLTVGSYYITDMKTELGNAMNNVGSANYSVSIDTSTNKYTITNSGSVNFYFTFGSNKTNSARRLLGMNEIDGTNVIIDGETLTQTEALERLVRTSSFDISGPEENRIYVGFEESGSGFRLFASAKDGILSGDGLRLSDNNSASQKSLFHLDNNVAGSTITTIMSGEFDLTQGAQLDFARIVSGSNEFNLDFDPVAVPKVSPANPVAGISVEIEDLGNNQGRLLINIDQSTTDLDVRLKANDNSASFGIVTSTAQLTLGEQGFKVSNHDNQRVTSSAEVSSLSNTVFNIEDLAGEDLLVYAKGNGKISLLGGSQVSTDEIDSREITARVTMDKNKSVELFDYASGDYLGTRELSDSNNFFFRNFNWQFDGNLVDDDAFNVLNSTARKDDASNLLNMSKLAELSEASGKGGYNQIYTDLVVDVGFNVRSSEQGLETSKIIYDAAVDRKSEFSGVDLDTEAARLLEQQQAYQALAKVLSTAKEMIDTLLRFM